MSRYYKLDGHNPVPCNDVLVWAQWYEQSDPCVALTMVDGVRVSTVFLGLDHNHFGVGPPLLFETMVFGCPLDESQWRYSTWDEAVAGHDAAVLATKAGE